jgi:hypothetical protein
MSDVAKFLSWSYSNTRLASAWYSSPEIGIFDCGVGVELLPYSSCSSLPETSANPPWEIDTLSYADAVPLLRKIWASVHNTLAKRIVELMKHFYGKPADYELSL